MTYATAALFNFNVALREAGTKIHTATRELKRREDEASSWMQRFISREIEERARTRDAVYWDLVFPGLAAPERAQHRIHRMLTRATVASVAAAAGATAAELLSVATEGVGTLAAVPLGLASVGAEMVYTTALQIDLAFDLASIYGVPFADDDVGEISTLLALALGVDLVAEPSRHDQPAEAGETKPWRVMRQMLRADFGRRVGREMVQQSVLRNIVPVAGILVSAAWNQVVLRRFAEHVHTDVRQRVAIVRACRDVQLGDQHTARIMVDGAWLIATADGDIRHQEALALAKLIDTLPLPERIAVHEASFPDDEERWFTQMQELDSGSHAALLAVLALVASADGELTTPERRFLKRVDTSLHCGMDSRAIDAMVARMRDGS